MWKFFEQTAKLIFPSITKNTNNFSAVRFYKVGRKKWPPPERLLYKSKVKKLWPPPLTLRQQAIRDLMAARIARTLYEYERPISSADLFARLKERGIIEHKQTMDDLLIYLENRKWVRKSRNLEQEGRTRGPTHSFLNYHYMMTYRGKFIMYICKKQAPYFPQRQNALLPTKYLDFEGVEEPQNILEDVGVEQIDPGIKLEGRTSPFYRRWRGKPV